MSIAPSIPYSSHSLAEHKGVHYEKIKALIPDAIKNAPPHRLKSLKENVIVPKSYQALTPVGRQELKELLQQHGYQQGELDSMLKLLQQNIQDFAKPLLTDAIKANFDVDLDVEKTTLRLYVPDKIIFGIDSGGTHSRHSSLLDAALHNFEEPETKAGAFRSGSGVYTADNTGSPMLHPITVEQFTALCRTLDIGAQYQKHIKSLLMPSGSKEQEALRKQAVAVEKSAFEVAAMTALMASDIGRDSQVKVQELVSGKNDIKYHERPLQIHRLRIMGFELSGVVLFSAVAEKSIIEKSLQNLLPEELLFLHGWSRRIPFLTDNAYEKYKLISDVFANGPEALTQEYARRADFYDQSRLAGPLIAYVPDDQIHPLKEYPSLTAFMTELVTQLKDEQYQQFFSRFVAQR
ncbi:MAG: dermonecrotic toxin domain-containing protein, partial [Pseudomonas fluorescens]